MSRFYAVITLLVTFASMSVAQQEPIRAELGKQSAWTGEAVPLIMTLYSPGPFQGTASFDLPRLPRTAIVKVGSPLVGSEDVDGESYLTQRHEFAVYTQTAGQVVIPSFAIRFQAKPSFTAEAEPVEGVTSELRYQSNRPPGTESLGLVIAARDLESTQSWEPPPDAVVRPGEVIQRTISRRARGTTAMMFPSLDPDAPPGVRVYADDPIVQDNTERGESSAERTETITYQFERPGAFRLPDQSIAWWDTAAGELKRETLAGVSVTIEMVAGGDGESTGQPAEDRAAGEPTPPWKVAASLLGFGFAAVFLVTGMIHLARIWRQHRNRPDLVASRRLLAACRADEAEAAYAALLTWKRSVGAKTAVCGGEFNVSSRGPAGDVVDAFGQESAALARHVFGKRASESPWSGDRLAKLFRQVRDIRKPDTAAATDSQLPHLNPPLPLRGS